MLDIKRLAILIIYQDGTVEFVPIGKDQIHMPYFRELRNISLKFRDLIQDLKFEEYNHYNIDAKLAESGAILLFNNNLAEMVESPDNFVEDFEPEFVVCLPNEYSSVDQKENFYGIIRGYDKDLLSFNRFINEIGYFDEGAHVNQYVLDDELMSSSVIGERK